ncbi:MAG: RDD family protein [Acidobacteriota bacterium]|nr:RDD family protein [Acidobacteriota bacterium]MDH3529245.1 RDD family protein [Acidobacteriota bacterium]
MSSKIERTGRIEPDAHIVRGFDAEKLRAPFVLRCGAMMIDYIVVLLIPVASLLLGRLLQYDGAKLLNSEINNTGWLITILLCLTNFVIFPMFSGQSIGKMATGLRLVRMDGTIPGFGPVIMRHLIGYPLTLASGMIGFLISLLNKEGRALHDFLAGTVVVYGIQRRRVRGAATEQKKKKVENVSTSESLA